MKRILITFPSTAQEALMQSVCGNVSDNELQVQAFNMEKWRFLHPEGAEPGWMRKLAGLLPGDKYRIGFHRVAPQLAGSLAMDYDLVDIHYFDVNVISLARYLLHKGKKVKINLLGSDLYRTNEETRKVQRSIFRDVHGIQVATPAMRNDFLELFPGTEHKLFTAHFGIPFFDAIDELMNRETPEESRQKLGLPQDALVMLCGGNAKKEHQHLAITQALNTLPDSVKQKLLLTFLFTYGGNREYIDEVEQALQAGGFRYRIFRDHLSEMDIARLRNAATFSLTMQTTDAFSGAIQEDIYARTLVFAGEWLPYGILPDHEICYIPVNFENLADKVAEQVERVEDIGPLLDSNRDNMRKLSHWKYAAQRWKDNYKAILAGG